MSIPSFEKHLSKIKDGIAWQDMNMRLSVPPEEMFAVIGYCYREVSYKASHALWPLSDPLYLPI
jgi:hypothetical protein